MKNTPSISKVILFLIILFPIIFYIKTAYPLYKEVKKLSGIGVTCPSFLNWQIFFGTYADCSWYGPTLTIPQVKSALESQGFRLVSDEIAYWLGNWHLYDFEKTNGDKKIIIQMTERDPENIYKKDTSSLWLRTCSQSCGPGSF